MADPVKLGELARRLGHTADWLYRPGQLERLYAEGMPRPLSISGRRLWDRASIDAWFGRHHPQALAREPANDRAGPPEPAGRRAQRAFLDRYFGFNK